MPPNQRFYPSERLPLHIGSTLAALQGLHQVGKTQLK